MYEIELTIYKGISLKNSIDGSLRNLSLI